MSWTTFSSHGRVEASWGAYNAPPEGQVASVALGLALAFPDSWVRVIVLGQPVIEGRGRFLSHLAGTIVR